MDMRAAVVATDDAAGIPKGPSGLRGGASNARSVGL